MDKRPLGRSGLQIYPIVFGGNVFGWTINEKQSFEILNGFTEAGFNCIDTADMYSVWAAGNSGGESETIIGKWMNECKNRQQLIIATKVGADLGHGKKGLKKGYILEAANDSLRRLRTDYIDLYQTHYDDDTPIAETLEAYEILLKAGKIRAVGTSNMTPERILQSLEISQQKGLPRYETLQPHYNLYARENYEQNYEPICVENELGVITYFSLESGFLTGKYRSKSDAIKSPRGGDVEKYLNPRGIAILNALDGVSKDHDATPAAVALAWLLSRPSVTAPIVSATSPEQLRSIIKAPQLKLSDADLSLLNEVSKYN